MLPLALCGLTYLRIVYFGGPQVTTITFESSSSVTGTFKAPPPIDLQATSRLRSGGTKSVVIMYDTRPPTARTSTSVGDKEYWSLAAYLNWKFACGRGYDFLYYQEINIAIKAVDGVKGGMREGNGGVFKQQITCYMNRKVGRATPW